MYIERKPINDLPKNAIILKEEEVVHYYNKQIFDTVRSKEIWPLKYGFVIAGFSTFFSNYYFLRYYRKRCKIEGFVTGLLLNLTFVALPATGSMFYHYYECRSRILLQNLCTSCLYTRAMIFQNMFSLIYGIIPSAFACLTYASIQDTFPVPGFSNIQDTKDTIKIWQKFTKRITPGISFLFVANTVIITYITHSEIESKVILDGILKKQRDKIKAVSTEYNRNQ